MSTQPMAMERPRSGAVYVLAWMLGAFIFAVALRKEAGTLQWWLGPPAGAFMALLVAFYSATQDRVNTIAHRVVLLLSLGGWIGWVARDGFEGMPVVVLLGGAAIGGVLEYIMRPPAPGAVMAQDDGLVDEVRPAKVISWENDLRAVTRNPTVGVIRVEPWENPDDGERVYVSLPVGLTASKLVGFLNDLAGARHLPDNCTIEVLPAGHQGMAILDVMLRDNLAKGGAIINEPTTPVSVYDNMPLTITPKGEPVDVCLREYSMLVGGTTGAGKTTLLWRIIFWFARATDMLIWVIDFNGGGAAWPWVERWANGEAKKPVVDWVATDPAEAAVMLAVAAAIARDRKVSPEANRRKREADTSLLPLDRKLPGILLVTDESAEINDAKGLLARVAKEGILRVVRIARNEGVRAVVSVLKGTADTIDRKVKSVLGVRAAMRMDDPEEYAHILGVEPKYKGKMHKGSVLVRRSGIDERPVLSGGPNVRPSDIARHSVACAELRPELDERALRVAARITVAEVLGVDPADWPQEARHPVMEDVRSGRAYTGRWDRKWRELAALRGEEVPEDEEPDDAPGRRLPALPAQPTSARPGSLAEAWLADMGVTREPQAGRQQTRTVDPGPTQPETLERPAAQRPSEPAQPAAVDVDATARALLSPEHLALDAVPPHPARGVAEVEADPSTVREAILLVMRDAQPDVLTPSQIRQRASDALGKEVTRQRADQVLKALEKNDVIRRHHAAYELVDGGDVG